MGRTTSFVVLINQIFFNITNHSDSPNEQVWEQQHFIIPKQNTSLLGMKAEEPKLCSHSQNTDQHYVLNSHYWALQTFICVLIHDFMSSQ